MRAIDLFHLARSAVIASRLRSALIVLAMSIGVGAVILLISLGDSARRYVVNEFASLGTNLLIVLPGRSETTGGAPPLMGETPHDLTVEDARALARSPLIKRVAPVMVGVSPVSFGGIERDTNIIGSTADMQHVRKVEMGIGRFLPQDPHLRPAPICVLGEEVREQLFGNNRVLGRWLRVGDRRCRVIGVIAPGGLSVGVNFDEIVIIPVASAQALFDSPALFRVLAEAEPGVPLDKAAQAIRDIIKIRHDGEDDVTVITQDSVVATFDKVMGALTMGVAGIAAISLLVAGILIMNVMLVSVAQRTEEIGLLKSVGATRRQIRSIFLAESVLISLFGSAMGWLLAILGIAVLAHHYPGFPVSVPGWASATALVIALFTGTLFGVLPAARAARLDPVVALSKR